MYGYVVEGYWCDVGNLAEYMRANNDILEGRAQVEPLGQRLGGGIWVGEGVEIAPDAQLYGPVFLGPGVKIKAGVIIHGPTAIHDYTVVDNYVHIDRSIIWRNCYIGEGSELRGAIIGRQCSLKRKVVVFEGGVLGDFSIIGEGAVIHPGVKIWPQKEVEAGATVKTSIIWGAQGRRVLFGRYGVTGLVNVDLTPELAARLGAAFAATLPKGCHGHDQPRSSSQPAHAQAGHHLWACHRLGSTCMDLQRSAHPGGALHHPHQRRCGWRARALVAVRQPRGRYPVLRPQRPGSQQRRRAQHRASVLSRGFPAGLPG